MMSKREHTAHQQRIIKRYYNHRDTIALTKLGELVSELALAEDEKKRASLWKRVEKALANASAPPERVERILRERDTAALAKLLAELS